MKRANMFVIAGAGGKCTLSNEVMHNIVKIWNLYIRQDPKKGDDGDEKIC